jgi:hypothetical protein
VILRGCPDQKAVAEIIAGSNPGRKAGDGHDLAQTVLLRLVICDELIAEFRDDAFVEEDEL